jgi:hypothetical protein
MNGRTNVLLRANGALAVLLVIAVGCATPVPSVSQADTPVPTHEDSSSVHPSASFPVSPGQPSSNSQSPTTAPTSPGPSGPSIDRYADGIPKAVDGEPVLRGAAALARAAATTDTTPFLVGGWVTYVPGVRFCTIESVGPNTPWSHDCLRAEFSDVAGALEPTLAAAVTFHFALADLTSGPIVARVEVHDPRASSCGTATAVCDKMMVTQQVVWAGDAATAPRPISLDAATRALAKVQRGATLVPLGPTSPITNCGWALPAAQVELVKGTDGNAPRATIVEVEPSTAARKRAIPQHDGSAAAFGSSALACASMAGANGTFSLTDYRWLVVANVAVMARIAAGENAADRAFVDRLSAALTAAASSGP